MKINEQWEALKEESHTNNQSERILNRQIRSIQTEGHLEYQRNDSFAVSITGRQKKYIKIHAVYAIGRNINKYHRFLHDEIKKFEKNRRKRLLEKECFQKMQLRIFVPKIHTERKMNLEEVQVLKKY